MDIYKCPIVKQRMIGKKNMLDPNEKKQRRKVAMIKCKIILLMDGDFNTFR